MTLNADCLNRLIQQYSKYKNANISAKSLYHEVELWKKLTCQNIISNILEIGCGNGLFLLATVVTGFAEKAIGVDPCVSDDGTNSAEFNTMVKMIKHFNLESKISLVPKTFEQFISDSSQIIGRDQILLFRNSLHHIYPKTSKYFDDDFKLKLSFVKKYIMKSRNRYVCIRETYYRHNLLRYFYNAYRKLRNSGPIDWKSKRDIDEWKLFTKLSGCSEHKSVRISTNQFINLNLPISVANFFSPGFLICAKI